MELAMRIMIFLAGIILIVKGGDWFVDAASWIAEVSGIPRLIVGATIVSLATTLPELLVSVMAAAQGKVDMAVGNAVGSVTANLGLIMAISVIFMPVKIRRGDYLLKSVLMLAASAMLIWGGRQGEVGLTLSLPLMGIFAIFTYENVRGARTAMRCGGDLGPVREMPRKRAVLFQCLKFTVGAAAVVLGADLLVDSASALARLIGISERIIGVTIVAVGTSLPELVTTITAIVKKQSALSVKRIDFRAASAHVGCVRQDRPARLPAGRRDRGSTVDDLGKVPKVARGGAAGCVLLLCGGNLPDVTKRVRSSGFRPFFTCLGPFPARSSCPRRAGL